MSKTTKLVLVAVATLIVLVAGAVAWEQVREPVIDWYVSDTVIVTASSTMEVLPEFEKRVQFFKDTKQGDEVLTLWATKKAVEEQRADVEKMEEEIRAKELELVSFE